MATHLAEAVLAGKPPVATMAREFLQIYPHVFEGRSSKDITDKVRMLIRCGGT